jgi:hypothetical protein
LKQIPPSISYKEREKNGVAIVRQMGVGNRDDTAAFRPARQVPVLR